MAVAGGSVSIYFRRKIKLIRNEEEILWTNLRTSSSCCAILLLAAEGMTSGGNICVRAGFVMLLLLLLEILIASRGFIVIVSDENKLMPLSVFMLPHLLILRIFESGNDFDVRIDDCVPGAMKFD